VGGRGELFVRRLVGPAGAVPVLLVHGWQATADLTFHGVYEPLGQRHPVVAADLRGHGRSLYPEAPFTLEDAADDQAALLEDLGIERAVVVGFSLGTAVAQLLVSRHRERVAGIVLVGGELAPHTRLHEKAYNRAGGWQGTAARATTGRWGSHRIVSRAVRRTPEIAALRGWMVAEMERGHTGSLRAAGRALGRFDGASIAAAHHVPAAVVVTRRDHVVRPERQERLAAAWDATTLDLDADHDAPMAAPAEFAAAIVEAVARTSGPPT
jgi:3-oxoadipate enol-lactonase